MSLNLEVGSRFYQKVMKFYDELHDNDSAFCENEFLKICSKLPLYGFHKFPVIVSYFTF